MSEGSSERSDPATLTDADFGRALTENPILIVDCWAPWCGPCRALAPLVDDLARTYHGRVAFGKVNVDDNPKIAQMYGVMSIPTLLFIKDGRLVDRLVGVVPRKTIEEKIRKLL
ncbi:thioredoxin [Candidatus Bathyarchaeota archaeon]|nr:thioredoxin [Candidatus Bathyarchaeota archaeon]